MWNLLVSKQQNLSSTDLFNPQSLRFSFPNALGALVGVLTLLLQPLDFSGVFKQSVNMRK